MKISVASELEGLGVVWICWGSWLLDGERIGIGLGWD